MLRPDKFSSPRSVYRFIILISYISGLFTAQFLLSDISFQPRTFWGLLFTSLPMALILIFSASLLGIILIPMSAFFSGLISCTFTGQLINSWLSGSEPELEKVIIFIIAMPVFFMISVNGMQCSEILLTSLLNSSTAVKSAYNREYIPMTLCVIIVVMALAAVIV